MPRLSILTEEEQLAFDYPPILNVEERVLCFAINNSIENTINKLRTPTNKVGFLLQYGYFKTCKRFFIVERYRQEDINYVARVLGINLYDVNLNQYKKKISVAHQKTILETLDYKPLNKEHLSWLNQEVTRLVKLFTEPKLIFYEIIQSLLERKIAIPTYHKISDMISNHYNEYEDKLLAIIKNNLTSQQIAKLDALLAIEQHDHKAKINQYKIINQSLKPKAIKASLALFKEIAELHNMFLPTIDELNLTQRNLEYYAT